MIVYIYGIPLLVQSGVIERLVIATPKTLGISRAALRRRLHAVVRCRRSRPPLDPLSAPSRSVEGIGEVLSLVRHLSIPELHNTHGVGALALVGNHILGNPEIALSYDP